MLAADAGVTKSDLAIWRDHLGQGSLERFVVLNKIDSLIDPLLTPAAVQEQIAHQRQVAAQVLDMPLERVFPLSARDALAARVEGDSQALQASRLLPLERALAEQLLPRRRQLLVRCVESVVGQLRASGGRRLSDRRRQQAEQLLELRGLRGKSGTRLRMMVERIDAEAADFERCTSRLAAMRAVQLRILRTALAQLSSDALRSEVAAMQSAMGARPFNLGARAAFETLVQRLRAALSGAESRAQELSQMLQASFRHVNTEFGFTFALAPTPDLAPFREELDLIEHNYGRYLGFSQAWRLAAPGFAEQFRRMLVSKLRVVFENAAGELEIWSKGASNQVEVQLRERRRAFARRREALQRVQAAAGELEQRIAEVQAQDEHLAQTNARFDAAAADAVATARRLVPEPQAQGPDLAPRQDAA